MAEPAPSGQPAYGRAFRIGAGLFGCVAALELIAIGMGVLRRPMARPSVAERAGTSTVALVPTAAPAPDPAPIPYSNPVPELAAPEAPALPPLQPDLSGQPLLDPPMSLPVSPPEPSDPALPAATAVSAPANLGDPSALYTALAEAGRAMPLPDAILEALLSTGAEHRAKGNAQSAIKNFREVESALPEHPRVLAELAATLSVMRLADKAEGYWERVAEMGVAAGAFGPIAAAQLRGEAPMPEVPGEPEEGSRSLRIGGIKVQEEAPSPEGQKVNLSVVIEADPVTMPDGEQMSLIVLFYDRLANGEVRPSTADTSYLYPTEPYDWQTGGTETILVNYHQPSFTEVQKLELGERSYHGYAIELYYRDQLQDKVAMPEDIATLRFPIEPLSPVARDPAAGRPAAAPQGPQNDLFPDAVIP